MDREVPVPTREKDLPFLMSVDTVMNISGRGCVVTGTIEQGKAKSGDDVHLIGVKRKATPTTITGIETFKKQLDYGEAGDNVGVLLRGILKDQVKRGQCLVKPGSLDVRRNFDAELYILKPEEGGRTKPFHNGYRPQCFIRTADVATDIQLPENMQMAMPGDNLKCSLKLSYPLPISKGLRFALREGGKTVAAGVISALKEDTEADLKEEEERSAKNKSKSSK